MADSEEIQLLFFDTFSHETSDDLKIDLVQFPKPLHITEIRIIPLGARVQADFPGGVRLGATNPSQFKIDFFINDFNNPRAATFETYGTLEYNQNGSINLECDSKVLTDGLVLRGRFTTITLAVYGKFPKILVKETIPAPVEIQAATSTAATAEWVEQHTPQVPVSEDRPTVPSDTYESPQIKLDTGASYQNTPEYQEEPPPPPPEPRERLPQEESPPHPPSPPAPPSPTSPPDKESMIRVRAPRSLYGHSPHGGTRYWGEGKRPRSPSTPPPPDDEPEDEEDDGPEFRDRYPSSKKRRSNEHKYSISPILNESRKGEGEGGLEPILSDEDELEDSESKHASSRSNRTQSGGGRGALVKEASHMKLFDPFSFQVPDTPPVILKDPCLTSYEWYKIHDQHQGATPEVALKQRHKLVDLVLNSSFDPNNITEDWVNTVEHICPLIRVMHHIHPDEQIDVLTTLKAWINIGLDYDKALDQAEASYKVRHIKIGVRLTEAMLSIDQDLNYSLLTEHDVDKKLIHLFQQEYMALSIKLLIIKTLDTLLVNSKIIEEFIRRDGYNTLLDLVQSNQLIRVKFAINNLLYKIHMHETLHELSQVIKLDINHEETLDTLLLLLDQVMTSYKQVPYKITQPKRFIPVSSQFEINSSIPSDLYRSIFLFYKEFGILENFLDLLSLPNLSHYNTLVTYIVDFINVVSESHDGLLFLLHYPTDVINKLLRVLLGTNIEDPEQQDTVHPVDSNLGVSLAYKMKVYLLLDSIHYVTLNNQVDPDLNEIVDLLYQLYCLSFTHEGKHVISHVLSCDKNISLLVKIYKSKAEVDLKQKSPSKTYISDLIKLTIKYSNHVPFLIKYSNDLMNLNNQDYPDLMEIGSYLKPLYIKEIFFYDDIFEHVDILKRHLDNVCNLSGEMITVLRILNYISGNHLEDDIQEYKQLRYKYVILQLYSLDGISLVSNILGKLVAHYEQAFIHMFTNSFSLMTVISLCVKLLAKMLYYVIQARNADYKDLTCIDTLLNIHTLCYYIPTSSNGYSIAQNVCKDVVTILLTYTLPVTTDADEKEALNKSLWSLMMTSVIKYVTNSPHLFIPGLCILSEMFPLPLPIQTPHDLSLEEITRFDNWRKLWCAHLHPLSSNLQEMIITLSGSSYQPILQLLRRVCIQLSDLAAPTALLVTKSILDTIISNLPDENSPCTNHTARLLHFLAYLISHPSIKMSFLHLVTKTNPNKNEDKYFSLLLSLCDIYRTPYPDEIAHTTSQDCIVAIIGTLVDTSICLHPPPPSTELSTYVTNALPYKDTLINIVETLIDHLSNPLHSFGTILPTLRTLLLISENDIGFYHIKSCVEFKKDPLLNLSSKLASSFSPDPSPEYLNSISSLLELIRDLLTIPPPSGMNLRTLSIGAKELITLLLWSKDHPLRGLLSAIQNHENPDELMITLKENLISLVKLLDETISKFGLPEKDIGGEPPVPPMEPLLSQFAARQIYVKGEVEEDKLCVAYWLAAIIPDEIEPDVEQIPCNILDEARTLLPNIDFAEHLKSVITKHLTPSEISIVVTPKKRPKIVPPVVIPSAIPSATDTQGGGTHTQPSAYSPVISDLKTRKPFVTPMRGRGFRTMGSSIQRGDIFRTRLPNTSRPPSLHVDDFVALETCGQQPTGPTGYNKIHGTMRATQDLIPPRAPLRGRGRGYILQPDRGGRFFPTMPQYRPARNILQPNWVPSHTHHPGHQEGAPHPPQPPPGPPHYHEAPPHPPPPPHGILHRPRAPGIRPVGWPPGPPPQIRGPPPGLQQRHMRPPPPQFAPR
uniref:Protein virilizer n=1 Tax=Cacopsylla melanoneura TaxID=428564 RepID=A0A8D8WPJ5_9HEMI